MSEKTNLVSESAQEQLAPELTDDVKIIRKCSFNPAEHLIKIKFEKTGVESFYLPVYWRLVWFEVYCQEMEYEQYAILENDPQMIGNYISASATVEIDGKTVGRAIGGCYIGKEGVEYAIQQAGTIAKGRALANAGFGTVLSAADVSENGNSEPVVDGGIQTSSFSAGFFKRNPMLSQKPSGQPETTAPEEQKKKMTREEALRFIVPTGRYAGEAMGDIMGKSPNTIKYFADNSRFDGTEIQTAAKTILNKS